MKRGVVIAGLTNAYSNGNDSYSYQGINLNEDVIRSALMYWDHIDIPNVALGTVSLSPVYDLLIKESVLSRTYVDCGMGGINITGMATVTVEKLYANGNLIDVAETINEAPVQAFYELSKDQTILWSYLKNSETVNDPISSTSSGRSLMFEIANRLPVPHEDIEFEDILNFKEKRNEELLALRCELDDIYIKVAQLPDLQAAKAIAFNKIDLAILDLNKVASESFANSYLKSLKAEINWTGAISAGATAGMISFSAGATAAETAIAGGAAAIGAGIKLSSSSGVFGKKLPDRLLPYKYVLDVKKELIKS